MSRLPVNQPYTITTPFGVPDSNALFGRHSGIDYAVPLNRPVYAPTKGTLTNITSLTGGNMVQIYDGKYYHRLMHNSSFSRGNGPVNEGEEVARAGTSGLSTGVHCHWDVAVRSVPRSFDDFINPDVWLKQGGNMPLTPGQQDKLIKMAKGSEPTAAELNNTDWKNDPGLAIDALWNNYGKNYYPRPTSDSTVLKPGKYEVK